MVVSQTLPIIVALGNWGLDRRSGGDELRTRQDLMRAEAPEFVEAFVAELGAGARPDRVGS